MNLAEVEVQFESLDGLTLRGSLGDVGSKIGCLLLHGAGADRHEDGLFDKLTMELNRRGISTLRVDLRGHGESDGKREWLTITSLLNDIDGALRIFSNLLNGPPHLIASSFSGGIAAFYAVHRRIQSVVLINPVLDYQGRYLVGKDYFEQGRLNQAAARTLRTRGWLDHFGVLRLNRYFMNELLWVNPFEVASDIDCPVLLFHGTVDTRVPFELSEEWISAVRGGEIILIEGADHEIKVPGDDNHSAAQTIQWHQKLIKTSVRWIIDNSSNRTL